VKNKCTSVGKPIAHIESKIINPDTGKILPWGETGEVCTRGYNIMIGYWDDEKKTKEAIDEKGWNHSGDLGRFDDDGFLQIVGRSKDLIIRGGENIYPKEIEDFLLTHHKIFDLHCIGVNDDYMGEEVCVWIRPKPDQVLDIEKIIKFCTGKIAHFKIPRYYRIVDAFPLTVTGKVQKNKMRDITNELLKDQSIDVIDSKKLSKQV